MPSLPRPPLSLAPEASKANGSVGAGPPETVRLRLIATSDQHMHLAAYDYYADQPCERKGLAMTASLIATARAEVPGAILMDNGDFLQGSPLGDYVSQHDHRPHPLMLAMNHLRYDVANLGNHEFSHGIPHLEAALAEAAFPCISANTHRTINGQRHAFVPPVALLQRALPDASGVTHTLRIGVVGVLPPQTAIWDGQTIAGAVQMSCMIAAVKDQVPRLRAAGADVIVVLAHCGIGTAEAGPMAENAGLTLAAIPGVDALVMGHVHLPFPGDEIGATPGVDPVRGTLAGKPAVMPGFCGSHLGVIDLDLAKQGARWVVVAHQSAARPVATRDATGHSTPLVKPDPAIAAVIAPAHHAAVAWARRPIGRTTRAIHSFFALVSDASSVQIVNAAQRAYVTDRLRDTPYAGLPVLSATAPFKAGGRAGPENYTFIRPGDLMLRNAADLYIHPNTIVALRLTGAEIRSWLTHSSLIYHKIEPGKPDQMLLNPDIPSFQFDMISGLSYQINLHGTPRIADLRLDGHPLPDHQEVILATNSYRSSGSGGFFAAHYARIVLADHKTNRDILISYLGRMIDSAPPADAPAWRFAPMPGTSVLFDTSPLSLPYLGDVPHLALTPLSMTPQGFQRFRLAL